MTDHQRPFVWVGVTAPRRLGSFMVWLNATGISADGALWATLSVGSDTVDLRGGESYSFPGLGRFTLIQVDIHPSRGNGGGNRAKFEVDLTPLYEADASVF